MENFPKNNLDEAIRAGYRISYIKDLDILLENILLEARRFTGADAGSIYIRRGNHLEIRYSQNDTLTQNRNVQNTLGYPKLSIPLNNKTVAGYVGLTGNIVNIRDVYNIPEEAPYSFDPRYDKMAGYKTRSMLVFPIKDHRDRTAGVLQLINALDASGNITEFTSRHETMALHFTQHASTALERAMMTRNMIMRMILMAELRDPEETGVHVNRVGAYSVTIYEQWTQAKKLSEHQIKSNMDILRMTAMLHDVGKIAITDTILKKPSKLTMNEYETIKAHTWMGARLFIDRYSEFDEAAFDIALNHHERWDGTGYPGYIDINTGQPIEGKIAADGTAIGKKGEEIPLFARIVSVADVYDALNSKRCYKNAWDQKKTLEIMKNEAGRQFDPDMIEAMMASLDIFHVIAARYPDQ
jgi:HD-GYP domain-containing protein (c-di-GMP phosphodiesterase class II)